MYTTEQIEAARDEYLTLVFEINSSTSEIPSHVSPLYHLNIAAAIDLKEAVSGIHSHLAKLEAKINRVHELEAILSELW